MLLASAHVPLIRTPAPDGNLRVDCRKWNRRSWPSNSPKVIETLRRPTNDITWTARRSGWRSASVPAKHLQPSSSIEPWARFSAIVRLSPETPCHSSTVLASSVRYAHSRCLSHVATVYLSHDTGARHRQDSLPRQGERQGIPRVQIHSRDYGRGLKVDSFRGRRIEGRQFARLSWASQGWAIGRRRADTELGELCGNGLAVSGGPDMLVDVARSGRRCQCRTSTGTRTADPGPPPRRRFAAVFDGSLRSG